MELYFSGGTQGSITSYEDILRSGIRECGANRIRGGCQYVPEYCSFTPVREGLAGGLCKECPIDMCAVEQPGWDLRRRQRRSRVTTYLCQQFGFCGAFGSGREVGRSYWSRMGSRWWQPGERWSESGWRRIGHGKALRKLVHVVNRDLFFSCKIENFIRKKKIFV